MICDFCYVLDCFKILYKDWIVLIYILIFVCRYSYECFELYVVLLCIVVDIYIYIIYMIYIICC